MRTPRIVSILGCTLMCWVLLPAASANEPAYVDSPAGRAVPDPARTDGQGSAMRTSSPAETGADQHAHEWTAAQDPDQERLALEQQIAEAEQSYLQRMAAAEAQQQTPNNMSGQFDPTTFVDPPVGGRDLAAEMRQGGIYSRNATIRTQPPPAPAPQGAGIGAQIGSGLIQDAAGILDTNLQRQLQGDNRNVVQPLPPTGP